ncbi:uncharacterized protein IL334_004424 [Kwoniella shivajii]|uniref:Uncharacterized protein n=1 Tax=Kwoniella shivajii TaxID=564305 RepID=A0ABZ1D0V8_9TREE|nr:hypothetical protein IL334_004424 [Kwoniella shivajii]
MAWRLYCPRISAIPVSKTSAPISQSIISRPNQAELFVIVTTHISNIQTRHNGACHSKRAHPSQPQRHAPTVIVIDRPPVVISGTPRRRGTGRVMFHDPTLCTPTRTTIVTSTRASKKPSDIVRSPGWQGCSRYLNLA